MTPAAGSDPNASRFPEASSRRVTSSCSSATTGAWTSRTATAGSFALSTRMPGRSACSCPATERDAAAVVLGARDGGRRAGARPRLRGNGAHRAGQHHRPRVHPRLRRRLPRMGLRRVVASPAAAPLLHLRARRRRRAPHGDRSRPELDRRRRPCDGAQPRSACCARPRCRCRAPRPAGSHHRSAGRAPPPTRRGLRCGTAPCRSWSAIGWHMASRTTSALGPAPGDLLGQVAWRRASRGLDTARRELDERRASRAAARSMGAASESGVAVRPSS